MSDDATGSVRDATAPRLAKVGVGNRWAVIVGVSAYRDKRLNLNFAADDARELAKLIQTPTGGGFAESNVLLLVDHQATSLEVIRALRSFLMKPAREDLVLIYFACHGGPDPRRPSGPLYLLTHDTELEDIAATAVPMDEIQGALRASLLSERVVVIADTCHSGNLGGAGTRATANAAEATNNYLGRLADSKAGVAVLTSCEAAESSQEHRRWGGGHGVFTWHLLEGMRGAADGFGQQRDGIVGVGELFEYVRDRVRADTQGAQHPSIGSTPFDRDLPMAATGDLDVQRHLALARHLVALGWLTDDPAAFACAVRETEAVDELAAITGTRIPASAAIRAEAFMATDRPGEAVAEMGAPTEGEEPHADLLRGVALAATGPAVDAAAALTRFSDRCPQDPESAWATDFAAALKRGAEGTRRALLIGAGTFKSLPKSLALNGSRNDVAGLADLLIHRLDFLADEVVRLVDDDATRSNILRELDRLAERAQVGDVIVVSFSGHSTYVSAEDYQALFATHDLKQGKDGTSWEGGIRGSDLAARLARIRGESRLLIIDSGMRNFHEAMSDQHDWAMIGPGPDQLTQEVNVDGQVYGAITRALLETWSVADRQVTCGDLVDSARRWMRGRDVLGQLTLYGDPNAPAAAPRVAGPRLWHLARDRSRSPAFAAEIERLSETVGGYGQAAWALGRAHLVRGRPVAALQSFDEARRLIGAEIALLEGDRVRALVAIGRTRHAASALADAVRLPAAPVDLLAAAAAEVTSLAGRRARALVVGIDAYPAGRRPRQARSRRGFLRPRGARADAESFAATLTRNDIVAPEDVVLLLDGDATRQRILAAFEDLAAHGEAALAVFHFAGLGSWTADRRPTILSVDARTTNGPAPVPDITLGDLAEKAASSPNLVAIIDAGSLAQQPPSSGTARTRPDPGVRVAVPVGHAVLDSGSTSRGDDTVLGAVTLAPAVPNRARDRAIERTSGKPAVVRGRLTIAVERALDADAATAHRPSEPMTYERLVASGPLRGRASVVGVAASESLLRHRTALASADTALRELELLPARSALALASALVGEAAARGESAPLAQLEAGLAIDALGDHTAAARRLRAARNLSDGSEPGDRAATRDGYATDCGRWASHHLGRILYQHGGDLNEAVAALTAANQQAPDEARTSYHLGLAIYTLVQRESLRDVEAHLRAYLDSGAPLGHTEEVEQIIDSIEST